jgi:preprotein translocase subunit SecF
VSAPTTDAPRRRNTLADLYHERTTFQFIAHSRRWLLLSASFLLVSFLALGLRQLNLGIDFEGGTVWVVPVERSGISVAEIRDVLRPEGFADSKVSILSGSGGDSIRVQAEVLGDPVQDFAEALARYAGVTPNAAQRVGVEGGGATIEVRVAADVAADADEIEALASESGLEGADVEVDRRDVSVTFDRLPPSQVDAVSRVLARYADAPVDEVSVSTVGPTWGERVSRRALQALVVFFVLLAVYLSFRFEWKMAAASIVAVIHDIVITFGVYALLQFEVTPATITAVLTILGFSLYDTVVVFDKVKENQASLLVVTRSTYGEMVNRSLNQVLMRSLSTSLVALLPVVSLLVVGSGIMGAATLEEFALALMVGLAVGSYSSLFVAAPLFAWWKEREPQYRALSERRRRTTGREEVAPVAPTRAPEPADDAPVDDAPARPVGAPPSPALGPRGRRPRGQKRR